MIIGIDAGALGVSDERLKAGVYHFCCNLLQNLSKIDKKNEYRLYSFEPVASDLLAGLGANWSNLVLKPKKGWLTLRLSTEFVKNKPDVFLGLGQALPLYHPSKNIVFVYDLAFELFPGFYPTTHKRLSRQTKYAVKNSDRIVAISKATQNDLVNLYGIDKDKITVIYPGIGIDSSTSRGVLRRPYFLFVGSYKPGKNISNIIKAFQFFMQETKKPFKLLLVGSNYWGNIEDMRKNRIETLGYVSESKLAELYKKATAFITPSYYEGFGMPILEAMSYGIPVITSNRGSIPEVVGEAALLVNPDDILAIKNAMQKIVTNDKLRKITIKKGLTQASKFSWEKSAMELLQLINKCR